MNRRPYTKAQAQHAARAKLEQRRRARAGTESLLDFVPRASPGFSAPTHLAPFAEALESTLTGPRRVITNVPPRHGKTETILHFIAWALARRPELRIGYATYAKSLALSKSSRARQLTLRQGVQLTGDTKRLDEWRTKQGGGLLAAGVRGGWSGHGVDIFIIDDPIKDRVEAESKVYRDRAQDFYNDVAYTRLEPGASMIINHTRWHPDDLSGRLLKQGGWDPITFQALDDNGKALWPERYSAKALEEIRRVVGPYTWASLYDNNPRKRGGTVFQDVHYYTRLPAGSFRVGIGVDLAYSDSTRADWSVIVVVADFGDAIYVIDVVRRRVEIPKFVGPLRRVIRDFPGTRPLFIHGGGGEKGVSSMLREKGVRLKMEPARGDKFTRAQLAAALWNVDADNPKDRPEIFVPSSTCDERCAPDCDKHPPPAWVEAFVDEVLEFTGQDGEQDDQVDALAAAIRSVRGKRVSIL